MQLNDSTPTILHRDGNPQVFELLLQEAHENSNDVLTMADLHPSDFSMNFPNESLRPYIFNLPCHRLQEVSNTLSRILLFIKKYETEDEEKHLMYGISSKHYQLDSPLENIE